MHSSSSPEFSVDKNVTDLFMQFPAMVCILEGPQLRCTFANQLYRRLYGDRELVGKTVYEMVPELQDQKHFKTLENVYNTGIPYFGYNEKVSADWDNARENSDKYFNFVYFPYQVGGKIIAIICFGMETTEIVLSRKAADESLNLINIISKVAPTPLWITDENMNWIFVNQTWLDWTGKPIGQQLGRGWLESVQEKDRGLVEKRLADSGVKKAGFYQEIRINCSDGSTRYAIISGSPWYNPEGEFGGLAGSITDITDRKQEEKRMKSLIDALPLMAWTATPEGELDYFNRRWFEFTGFSPDEAYGDGWSRAIPEADREDAISRWRQSVTYGVPYEAECIYRNRDGENRWHIVRAEPIKDDDGKILYWLGTSTDIHDRKVQADVLEQKVRERTQALTSSNLQLVRSNEDLERFASVASHDLKEPLRKILFFSDMLQSAPSKDPEEKLKKIRDAANRMMTLIDDLLEFSSLSRASEQFEEVDLNDVLEEVLLDLELAISESGFDIKSEKLPVINAIPHQIGQMFTNLLGNAIKYRKAGVQPIMRISVVDTPDEDLHRYPALDLTRKYKSVVFADNGIGFSPGDAERIFTIFQRLHSRDAYTGTGVGLALCRKVAHNHCGEIYARSSEGMGSEFHVILPVD